MVSGVTQPQHPDFEVPRQHEVRAGAPSASRDSATPTPNPKPQEAAGCWRCPSPAARPSRGEPGGVLPGTTGALGSRWLLQMPHCIRLTVPHALRVGRAAKRSAGWGGEASGIPIIPTASSAPPLGSRGRASCGEIAGIKWDG